MGLVEQFSGWCDEDVAGKWQLLSAEHGLLGPALAVCLHLFALPSNSPMEWPLLLPHEGTKALARGHTTSHRTV